jgi:hypothetical protein
MKTKLKGDRTDGTNRSNKGSGAARRGFSVPSARYAKQPLRPWQKRELSMRAKVAFDQLVKYEAIEQPPGLSKSAWFEQWKHAEQGRALKLAGPVSLNDCKQANVRDLEIWFDTLAGKVTDKTFERALSAEDVDEGRRQRMQRLQELLDEINARLTELGVAAEDLMQMSYAATISQSVLKCPLTNLLPERFPAIMATVRKRGEAKIEKAKAARRES